MSLYTELKSKNDILRKEEIPHYKIATIKSFTCEIQNIRSEEEIEWVISQVEKGKFCITNFSIFKKWIDKHEDRLIKKKRIKANAETLYRSVAYQHKFNEYQLDEIYKGYKNGVDARVYAKEEYPYTLMSRLRVELEEKLERDMKDNH